MPYNTMSTMSVLMVLYGIAVKYTSMVHFWIEKEEKRSPEGEERQNQLEFLRSRKFCFTDS